MTSSEHTTPPEHSIPSNGRAEAESMPQVAVWYFIAATFVFAAPNIWFPDVELWGHIAIIAFGMLLVVLGGIRLGKEVAAYRRAKQPPTGAEPPAS